ncbi:MAG: PaaI family thioesterase [Clostridia bacterium]|jgi:acyl-coenzyme A thioesterase PaaI-like protein|nr:PaaI family thioesterase [Clostridia bacterium]MBT7122002.1 PaaI family thioesterase [Clostridia bacterium]
MKKIVNKQSNAKHCFVCGVDNAIGLHASFFETDRNEVVALFTPTSNHQGYPVRLHGGVAASILDEAIGRAIQIDAPDTWGVTAQLSLSYKKPLPCDTQLRAVGRITKQNRLLYEGTGEIYTPDGEVAISAKAKYVKMSIKNISEDFIHDDWQVYPDINDPTQVDID